MPLPRDNVPPLLLSHFKQLYQTVCWMGVIELPDGTWEAFTSLDEDLHSPLISSVPNAVNPYLGAPWNVWDIPALTYQSLRNLELSAQPNRLNLGRDETDATVLALNKERLLQGGYNGCAFEIWRANYEDLTMGRDVRLSGEIGNARVGATQATWALVPWPAKTEMSFERKIGPMCDVGIYPNEKWGTCRCSNTVLFDGPKRDDWSAGGAIVSAASKHQMRISFGVSARSGAALGAAFINRLREGDVEFISGAAGGQNAGAARSIKGVTVIAPRVVDVELHGECFFVPAVGDSLWLVAGCDRTEGGCLLWNNMNNFTGFNLVPGETDARRRYSL